MTPVVPGAPFGLAGLHRQKRRLVNAIVVCLRRLGVFLRRAAASPANDGTVRAFDQRRAVTPGTPGGGGVARRVRRRQRLLITTSGKRIERDVLLFPDAGPAGAVVRMNVLFPEPPPSDPADDHVAHLLYQDHLHPCEFDEVLLSPVVRSLVGSWFPFLVHSLSVRLRDEGVVRVRYAPDHAPDEGVYRFADLKRTFGPGIARDGRWACIPKRCLKPGAVDSTLLLHLWHFERLILTRSEASWDAAAEVLNLLPPDSGGPSLAGRRRNAVKSECYLQHGTSYKAPIVSGIVRHLLDPGRELRYVDLGGAYGLHAAEVLMDPSQAVTHVTIVDSNLENTVLSRLVHEVLPAACAGGFEFIESAAESYQYRASPDVVSLIGSLLYFDPTAQTRVLDNAWDALAGGGLLIVHENIKHERFVRDYSKMFTADELDRMLGRYGTVRYFSSKTVRELSRDDVADNTKVFRVVQKRT